MRILVIDEEFPYPLDSGKRIRSYNLLSRLAHRCELHYLAFGSEDSESYAALSTAGMNPIPVPATIPPQSGPLFYFRLAANLLSRYPYIVERHYSKLFQNCLRDAVANLRPDVILCEWTPYAAYVREKRDLPTVVVAHNLEQRIWRRYYEHEASPLKKWYIGRQVTKVSSFEHWVFNTVDGAVAVSGPEASEIMSMNADLRVQVVENGVDPDYFSPSPEKRQAESLVFVGAMHWRPNQDAVQYFVDEILPRVREHRPEVVFTVIGQGPPSHIQKLAARPGVRIVGRVEDVRPYVDAATVFVVPLRIGGGTRLKILEALAMSKAVVSTSVGAEGLDLIDGTHIMIADTASAFAERIEKLMADTELRGRLGEAGQRLVRELYVWDTLAEKLRQYLTEVVSRYEPGLQDSG
jgi:sugar transferase (PEP-CTERM/EpsH1 system associated)